MRVTHGLAFFMKSYTELSQLKTSEERFEYLKTHSNIGIETFGSDRYLNQMFYKSPEWRSVRNKVILRDNGCDLGIPGLELESRNIVIHHMNPIKIEDVMDHNLDLLNPEYLVCVSVATHKQLNYGDLASAPKGPIKREPNDTCPWKKGG